MYDIYTHIIITITIIFIHFLQGPVQIHCMNIHEFVCQLHDPIAIIHASVDVQHKIIRRTGDGATGKGILDTFEI